MASLEVSSSSPKVTLTNWQRLNNSPIVLPEASTVQWNEYMFVLAGDGRALLYHSKHSLWSSLPHCTHSLPNGPPLAIYKGEIITMSTRGDVVSFDLSSSAWKEVKDLKLTLAPHDNRDARITKADITSDNDTLYAFTNWDEQCCGLISRKSDHFFHTASQSGWTESSDIQNYQSAVLVKSNLYMIADNKMYKIQRNQTSDSESTPIILSAPPLTDSTLHVVKDTLFSFGGRDKDNQPSSDVLRYNPDSDSWESAGYMRSSRYNVAVTTIQQDDNLDVFVMGGSFGSSSIKPTNKLVIETKSSGNMSNVQSANPWLWDCSTSIVEKCMVE